MLTINARVLPLSIIVIVIILLCICCSLTQSIAKNTTQNKPFVFATYSTLRTLDPCAAYDAASFQRIMTMYEPLIFYKGHEVNQFIPVLATNVPTYENGGIINNGLTYMFSIRKNVHFHNGQSLTPEDVVYSFKRNMIADPTGGPMWMLLEALTGHHSTRDQSNTIIPGIFEKIDHCIEFKSNKVIFKLYQPFPPFLGILASSSAVVLNKQWAIKNGCWDGTIHNAHRFNNPLPGKEPLHHCTNGTGAYEFSKWEPSKMFVFERFDHYWGTPPAIKTAIIKYVKEWSTRKLMLQNGDAHRVTVDPPYYEEVKKMKGVSTHIVPQLSVSCMFMVQNVTSSANTYIGSGKLDGKGISPDFFSDTHIRKAFLHAFDRKIFQSDVLNQMGEIPSSPLIKGLAFHQDVPIYAFDLDQVTYHLKQAWQGKVWKMGFTMTIASNTGNEIREAAALMLSENLMRVHPKIKINVVTVDWKDYLVRYRNRLYPVFITGWVGDYADPHNFMYSFLHSKGVYGRIIGYDNPEADQLCEAGIRTINSNQRQRIYQRLQNIWYEDALGLALYQQTNLRAYRNNVKGYSFNPMLTDAWEDLKQLSIDD